MSGSLIPNGKQQYLDANGAPLAGGKVYYYIPYTTTAKNTWQDINLTILNTNPIILDSAGECIAWGSGAYRQQIYDVNDNLIWDQYTYGISPAGSNFISQEEVQIATQGQVLFTLATITYAPGINSLVVFVNGSKQVTGTNYTETAGNTVTFVTGLNAGDVVDFYASLPATAQNMSNAVTVAYNPPFINSVSTNVQAKLAQTVSVKDFGAKGDGTTDDTTAINNALAFMNQQAFASGGADYIPVSYPEIFFPAGKYIYSGSGFSTTFGYINIRGENSATTEIRITSSVYLITATASGTNYAAQFLSIKNIHFNGGLGACVLLGNTSVNTAIPYFIIENNIFFSYSQCAIGHSLSNMPNWIIRNNTFHGALTSGGERQSIGVCIGGLSDGSVVEQNQFEENLIGLKLFAVSLATSVTNNAFFRWTTSPGNQPSTDIWIVPGTSAPNISNADIGLMINQNKFGNENLLTTDYRILIADENTGTGTNHITYPPLYSTVSGGYLGGVNIKDNIITGAGSSSRAFVFSTTPNLYSCNFDNTLAGTPVSTLDFLSGSINDNNDANTTLNTIKANFVADASYLVPVPSTFYKGPVDDPLSLYQGYGTIPSYWKTGSDPSYIGLAEYPVTNGSYWGGTSVTSSQVTDACGGNEAVQIVTSAAGANFGTTIVTPQTGRMGFISFDISQSSSNSLTQILIVLSASAGAGVEPVVSRYISLPTGPYWRRITLPFVSYNNPSATPSLNFFNVTGDYSAGTKTTFKLGRVRVYNAFEPVDPNTLTLDSGLVGLVSPGTVSANSVFTQGLTITGAQPGDYVIAAFSNTVGNCILSAEVPSSNNVTVKFANPTGSGVAITAGYLSARVIRRIG